MRRNPVFRAGNLPRRDSAVYGANLDGSDQKTLLFAQGNLTGIAYAEIQTRPPAQGRGSLLQQ
jgi:hypothetical protein